MDSIVENVTTTATVIGFPVLVVIVLLILWFGTRIFRDLTKIFNEMRYERWKRRHAERDWDNIEASWALELDPEVDDEPYIPVQRDLYTRHDTLELPDDFAEQLHNYKGEPR